MERLAQALTERGEQAVVVEGYSPAEWRRLMSSGSLGRLRARAGAMLFFPVAAGVDALRGEDKVVVSTTNPFFLPFALTLGKALHGRTVVALLYDLYPEALEATGNRRPNKIAARIGSWMNRFVMGKADGVVFIGKKMADHVRSRYGDPRRELIAETGAMSSEYEGTWTEDSSEDRQILSYVGNLGLVHDWETVAQALPEVLSEGVRLVCAASGPGVDRWEQALGHLHTGLTEFVGPLDDQPWRELLVATDISLVTLRSEAAHTSIPSKLFSAMAAGCAVVAIAPEESDLADVVTDHQCGRVVSPGDTTGMIAALNELLNDREELDRCKAAAKRAVEDHYDISVLAEKWQSFLLEARKGRTPGIGYRSISRCSDLIVALAVLVVTSPILVVIASLNLILEGSPILFSQERPGLHGKPFRLIKFRTMRRQRKGEEGAEADGLRLSKWGRLLRGTSLDELPTFWNVLVGDMSLVGPRPLLMEYLDRYSAQQARRHDVKPGVTGWAQVNGRNAITWEEKFDLDVVYVENQGLWFDLRILLKTVLKVFQREGVSSPDHATMPEFMGSEREIGGVEDD